MTGRQHAYVLVRDWLPAGQRLDRDRALAELARRYLTGHGPADERDLARWAGLPLRDARAGLDAIAAELEHRPGGLVDLRGRRAGQSPKPRLLGAFEPLLLGWNSREPVLAEHAAKVVSGGIFRGFALAGGRAVGLWRLRGRAVELEPCAARAYESGSDQEAVRQGGSRVSAQRYVVPVFRHGVEPSHRCWWNTLTRQLLFHDLKGRYMLAPEVFAAVLHCNFNSA